MYTFLLKIFLSALLLLSFSSGNAMAQTLYGAADTDNNFRSELYTIDPQNGDSTLVGDIGFTDVTGLAFLPDGRLIGLASGPTVLGFFHSILIEINPSTGAGKLIGETNGPHQTGCGALQADISFDRTRNILFGIGEACNSPHHLYTIDLQTGDATGLANSTGFNSGGNGLAVHPQTGTIYNTPGAAGNSLVTLDPGTGIGTLVPGSGGNIPYTINALDFHPATLELYGSFRDVNAGNNFLVKISLTDGKTTTLGPTVPELNAIVFSNFCGDGQLAFNEQCDDGN
ncbi:MAG TPA: hypothetical protein DF383_04810, partial [Deltaproteobacteria bacterium]|nr:hypothetical protein [Deltaproteobacteria bacterium]